MASPARGWKKTPDGWEPTDERMKQIIGQIKARRPYKLIADEFGISISRVSKIKRQAGMVFWPRECTATDFLTRKPRITEFTSYAHRRQYMESQLRLAVKKGFLLRPTECSACRKAGVIHGHHHKGYEWEHRFDVVWLCVACHRKYENPRPDRQASSIAFANEYRGKISDDNIDKFVKGLMEPLKQLTGEAIGWDDFCQLIRQLSK